MPFKKYEHDGIKLQNKRKKIGDIVCLRLKLNVRYDITANGARKKFIWIVYYG